MGDKNTSYSGAGDKIYALFVLDIAHSRGALLVTCVTDTAVTFSGSMPLNILVAVLPENNTRNQVKTDELRQNKYLSQNEISFFKHIKKHSRLFCTPFCTPALNTV